VERFRRLTLVLAIAGVTAIAGQNMNLGAQQSRSSAASDDTDTGVPMVIEGLARDVACPMQNHKSTAKNFNLDCALACAKAGSPLIILTEADEIYFPISWQMPDPSQRERLMPFIGKYVRATGIVYMRNGTRVIVLKSISEMKNVKLKSKVGDE
jgi:hypothetical protein